MATSRILKYVHEKSDDRHVITPRIRISAAAVHMYIFACFVFETIASDCVCLLCEVQELFHWDLWGYSLRGRWQVQAFERCFETVLCYVAGLGTVEHSKHCLNICWCKKRALREKQRWGPSKLAEQFPTIYYAIRTILLDFFILFNSFKRKALGSSGRL